MIQTAWAWFESAWAWFARACTPEEWPIERRKYVLPVLGAAIVYMTLVLIFQVVEMFIP